MCIRYRATDQSAIRTWPCMNTVIFTHNLGNWLIAASHYVTRATHPLPSTLQRRRCPSGRPWPGRILGRVINDKWTAPAGPGRFLGLVGRVFSGRAGPGFRPDHLTSDNRSEPINFYNILVSDRHDLTQSIISYLLSDRRSDANTILFNNILNRKQKQSSWWYLKFNSSFKTCLTVE